MPEELAGQIEPLIETIEALGWPIVVVDGVEADDVIGTWPRWRAARAGRRSSPPATRTSRSSWTSARCGSTRCRAIASAPEGVKDKFGVPPERIVDYLALVGDAVDNVPGVEKVGPKTAAKLIQQYGSLDGVIANADKVKGVVGENLRKALDWLPTAKAAGHGEMRRGAALRGGVAGGPRARRSALAPLYERFGFRTLRDSLLNKEDAPEGAAASPAPEAPAADSDAARRAAGARSQEKKGRNFAILNAGIDTVADVTPFVATRDYETVFDAEALERWARKVEDGAARLHRHGDHQPRSDARRAGGPVARAAPGEGAYIPLTHRYAGAPAQLPLDQVLARLKPWLEDPAKAKVGQNTKYDRQVLANYGIATRGFAHDTLLQSYVLESHQRHDMDALAARFLGATG